MKNDHIKSAKFAKEVAIKKIVASSRRSHNVTIVKNLDMFKKIVDSKIKNKQMLPLKKIVKKPCLCSSKCCQGGK